MKLCNVCLKTFKDNYALNRHINKQKKCTDITTKNNSIPVDASLQLITEDNNEKKLIIIKSKDKHNGHNDIPKTSIIEPESLIDTTSTVKKILIKKYELNTKNDTIIRNIPIPNNNNKICNIKLNAKLEQTGELYNCSLCKVEFKHKNNFYRHKKTCIILTTHQ